MTNDICLSIIIINYNNYVLTKKCIESVLDTVKSINYEIIVVDNDSPNDSYEQLSKSYENASNIKVIKNNKNIGFGGANNLGVNISKGEYVLLLNPDIIVIYNAVEKMLDKIKNDKEVGLVSGKLLNDDNTVQYSCRRILPAGKFLMVRTPLSKLIPSKVRKSINDNYLMKDFNHNYTRDVEWVMGACMMMRKKEFIELGGFSKEYFMYFEDVDLCYKVRKNNKKVIYLYDAEMIHLHRQESKKKFNKMTIVHLESMMKFYYKFYMKKF